MITTGNIFFDTLIWLNIYGYYVLGAFVPSVYYIWLRIFSFPIFSRKSHEVVLMITPESVKIKKIKTRIMPFFIYKKGIYWFSEPFEDFEKKSKNKFHVFIEGINQELSETSRRDNKVDEILTYPERVKALAPHKVLLPNNLKDHMQRHYVLTIEPQNKVFKLTATKERQNHKYSFYHTLGIQIQSFKEPEEIESETESSNAVLTQLTTQTILSKIKYIQEYAYFSSYSTYLLWRKIKKMNSNFVFWLLGTIDPKILIVLILMFGSIALVWFGMPLLTPDLGPMPTN